MMRSLGAAMILIIAACASAGDIETGSTAPTAPVETPTEVPTTQVIEIAPTVAPTAVDIVSPTPTTVPTATAETVPSPESTLQQESPSPTAVATDVPQSVPSATAAPTVVVSNDSLEVRIANGAEVYLFTCARCHGANGGGEIYGGLLGVGRKYSEAGMIDELTNGHPVTFGFANELSADEIASVVAYVKAAFP